MFDIKSNYSYKNGKNYCEKSEKIERNYFSRYIQKFQLNEWTFSLFLFILSLTIVAAKVIVMYGNLPTKTYDIVKTPNLSIIGDLNKHLKNYNLFNTTREYNGTFVYTLSDFFDKFGWFIKAAVSGISLMSFTWFIVYKDSKVPGVNPPSPFSPNKRKFHDDSRIQMNYFIGVINGILIFIYMCL